jgi:ubiquinone/menaquinone biosynthesis C-methylase UbiE
MKDNFSAQSSDYSKYRPTYPKEMIDHILSFVDGRQAALDVATGNGQLAKFLADHFQTVYATDISDDQLKHAPQILNVIYRNMPAEQMDFDENTFDLITVAQAVHWFDFDMFYNQVQRILKPGGIIALLGYGMMVTNPDSDRILWHFYNDILGPFWDPERRLIEEEYKTIPFPFEEIQIKSFCNVHTWSFEQLSGYLETWSATEHYKAHHNQNPLDIVREELRRSWEKSDMQIKFPMLLRVGKPNK